MFASLLIAVAAILVGDGIAFNWGNATLNTLGRRLNFADAGTDSNHEIGVVAGTIVDELGFGKTAVAMANALGREGRMDWAVPLLPEFKDTGRVHPLSGLWIKPDPTMYTDFTTEPLIFMSDEQSPWDKIKWDDGAPGWWSVGCLKSLERCNRLFGLGYLPGLAMNPYQLVRGTLPTCMHCMILCHKAEPFDITDNSTNYIKACSQNMQTVVDDVWSKRSRRTVVDTFPV